MIVIARIKELRIKSGLSMKEMANKLNMPYTTYINYEKGYREPHSEVLIQIANFFNVSVDYLIGNKIEVSSDILPPNIIPISQLKRKKVPMLGHIACGKPIFADENRNEYVLADGDIKADFCLTCEGDSMTGARINNGDIVFIQQADMVDNGEIAAVIIEDEATLKRVYYYPEKNKLILNAENPKYEPLVFIGEELDHIRILGRAVAFQSVIW